MSSNENLLSIDCTVQFRKELKEDELRRLILIDGFNIMHHFKNMGLENPSIIDERMCPLVLLPLVCYLMKEGFIVRVVLKNIPRKNKISESYILTELQATGLCIFGLHADVAEEDDLVMLRIAKEYGALIISRDQFRNHKVYEEIARNNVVEFDKISTGCLNDQNSTEKLQDGLCFKYRIDLHESPEKFIVDPSNIDYELVQKSMKKFKKLELGAYSRLMLIYLYTHAQFCYVYNVRIPRVLQSFINADSFPMIYSDFIRAYDAREEYEVKHRIYKFDKREKDDISDVDDVYLE
uniref:RNase NYN domain-containing protein n=1 Tax=Panagrolaimus sp. PS1159 TaxID=55785 RepID=A0AC35F4J5_9BILA